MKVGIVTFWWTKNNYGQVLQCFALQAFLKKNNLNSCLIRIIPKEHFGFWSFLKYCRRKFLGIQPKQNPYEWKNQAERGFEKFLKKNISMTDEIYTFANQLRNIDFGVKAFVCGSDVIWNHYNGKEGRKIYFLNFAPKQCKRISYAASFGTTRLHFDFAFFAKRYLKKFDSVSVRETVGVELCKSLGRKDAVVTCDPTLLLTQEDYLQFIQKRKKKRTLFLYFLGWETEFDGNDVLKIKNYAAQHDLAFRTVESAYSLNSFNFDSDENLTPAEWLSAVVSSEVVLTNSFHGIVFCLIFHKNFICLPLKGRNYEMNSRMFNLLQKVDLMERVYHKEKSFECMLNASVDWEKVDAILEEWRTYSANWLKNALEK